MSQTLIFMVSDDHEAVSKAKQYWETQGITVQVYSPYQWREGLEQSVFRSNLSAGIPALVTGNNGTTNVLPFPGTNPNPTPQARVATMDELESHAIENAIAQYKGNLTEAAKALGIGRATLYRKVKQYNIDPAAARKKRAA